MDKKTEEKIILSKFIEAYKEIVDYRANFEILEKDVAQNKFPNYNGENPDFVVLLNGNFIGIELFELIRNKIEELNRINSTSKLDIKNVAHLCSIREKEGIHELFLMEDLVHVAFDRINDKIQNKLKNYVACPIWLVGYAHKSYNLFLLSPYYEDNIEKEVSSYISDHILNEDRIHKIFLVEFSSKNLLMQIK